MRNIIKFLQVLAALLVIFAFSFVSYDFIQSRQAFPAKTLIEGIDVSFLTQEQAVAKLGKYTSSQLYAPKVVFAAVGKEFVFPPDKIGLNIAYRPTIKNAFRYTHRFNYFDDLKERIVTEKNSFPIIYHIDKRQMQAVLEGIADEIFRPSQEAKIILNEARRSYRIKPEIIGRKLDLSRSFQAIIAGFRQKKTYFSLVVDQPKPRISARELQQHPPVYRLSSYATFYGKHDSVNRLHNIKLIASLIDGLLLVSGETFSAADFVGAIAEEKGFKDAYVILQGELVPHPGGGACQIATTLYNAVSLADLEIVKRRNHSFYFNIYPLGRDAALYPGQIDFKFKNDTPYPVLIKTTATDHKLSFRVYGSPARKQVMFSSPVIYGRADSGKFLPMPLEEIIEKDIPFRTEITRTVRQTGRIIKKEIIRSYYKLYGDKDNVPIRRPES